MNIMNRFWVVLSILIFSTCSVYAQNEKMRTVNGVRGEFSVVLAQSDVTGREAAQFAREDAKRKALESVCGTKVSIWDQMEVSSAGDTYNSLSVNSIDGEIVEFEIIDEGFAQSPVRDVETIFYCVANIKVKFGVSADPDFVIAVNGLRGVYYAGDVLTFSVLPYRDCYMKIFLLDTERTGYMLYPNIYDKPQLLPAGETWSIETSKYEFVLEKSPNLDKEVNRLVFVFTKTERPFNQEITSRSEIEKWIASIPNDQKFVYFSVMEIL